MAAIDFDRPRQLKYDLAAIRDLEAACGGEPLGVLIQRLANLGVNALVLFLWAGLKHEDRAVTPNLVEKRLETYLNNGNKVRTLADAINAALEECGLFKSAQDESPSPPTPTPASP